MSSTVIAKNVQIGADGTASNNFTIFQPATPDGTLRIGNGNTGITASLVAMTSAGNVGIGTSSPSAKLDVSTSINLSAQNYLNVAYDLGGGAGWLSGYNITYSSSSIRNVATGTLSGVVYGGSGLQFYTNTSAAAGTAASERMRIDSSGNVGIGTSSPTNKLHAFSSSSTATVAKFGASNYGNAGTTYVEIGTQYGDGGSRIGNINPSGNLGTLVFETMTGTSGVFAERARIDSSGRLGVGTSSPTSDAKATIYNGAAGNFALNLLNASAVGYGLSVGTDSSYIAYFYASSSRTAPVGNITTNGSSTSYGTSSDYRLKHDIQPMTGALAKVAALKPCTYKWNANGSTGEGFIAHELADVCPDAVSGEKDAVNEDGSIKPQGIDTSFLVATLTAAIQEQQAIITALTARVTALEGQS